MLLLGACEVREEAAADAANGGDPIAALSSTTPSTRYRQDFWAQASQRDRPLWDRAVALCRAAGGTERVNCEPVRLLDESEQRAKPPTRAPRGKINMRAVP